MDAPRWDILRELERPLLNAAHDEEIVEDLCARAHVAGLTSADYDAAFLHALGIAEIDRWGLGA